MLQFPELMERYMYSTTVGHNDTLTTMSTLSAVCNMECSIDNLVNFSKSNFQKIKLFLKKVNNFLGINNPR